MLAAILNLLPLLKKVHRFLIAGALLKEREKEVKHLRNRLRKVEKMYKQAVEKNGDKG